MRAVALDYCICTLMLALALPLCAARRRRRLLRAQERWAERRERR